MSIINRFASENFVTEYLKTENTRILESFGLAFPYEPVEDNIPSVFITGDKPTTKDNVLAEMIYTSKTLTFHSYIKIKCQGTSSMKYPKKNFTISLYDDVERSNKLKINFRNWGEQNKFCLKANWIDISHSRNIVSAKLWGDVVKSRPNYEELPQLLKTSPNQGAIDGFFIKVYYNGIYQGRYTWNIPKDAWMTNMDDSLNNHCILCGEDYNGACFRTLPIIDGSDWSDEVHDAAPDNIKTRWTEVVNFVMNSSDEEFKANIENYFDLQSLIDYHLFGLSICGLDSYGKNQIYMTYDGNKWIASAYDLDSTWGLYWNGETLVSADYLRTKFEDMVNDRQGNLLYFRLEQNFSTELSQRWQELKLSALSLPNIINKFERFLVAMTSDLIREDYASTTANGAFSGIPSTSKNNIQQIRNFAFLRQQWTDDYLTGLLERVPCTKITLSDTELTFTEPDVKILIATVEPEDTTDKVIWSSSNKEVATVDNGIVSAVFNGNTTITVTCGEQTATCEVSVSGIDEPVGPSSDGLVYSLPEPTTFNGTNFIDTGVAPLAEDKPFTVLIDWTHTGESDFAASKHVVAHCMTESSPYPGFILQYSNTGLVSEIRQTQNISQTSQGADIANADLFRAKIAYRKADDGTLTISRCYNENGVVHTNSKASEYIAVPEELRLGCYRSNVGGTGRFAAGLMNDCKVYNIALTDEQIKEYLTSSTF